MNLGRILLTGGTGFVGKSLIERFSNLVRDNRDNFSVTILARHAGGLGSDIPLLRRDWLRVVQGDVLSLPSNLGQFDGIIHAATPSSLSFPLDPEELLNVIVNGTRNVLKFAKTCGEIPVLFTSSGAVYGRQGPDVPAVPETYQGGPSQLDPRSVYAEAKRVAELQCAIDAGASRVKPKIARMFAFVGPHLPLDRHFAIGNFIGDVLAGRDITVTGDGTAVRSYLHSDDMADWLLAVLTRGEPMRAYNVGSDRAIDVASLARLVAETARTSVTVNVLGSRDSAQPVDRYVPDTQRIRSELGVKELINLEDAIAQTIQSHRHRATRALDLKG